MEEGPRKHEKQNKEMVRRLLGKNVLLVFKEFNLQRQQRKEHELTEEEEMKQQQRTVILKDLTRKIK